MVKIQKASSCDSCASKKACKPVGESDMLIEVENTVGAKVGQQVIFTVGSGSMFKAGVLFYLVPLLSFIAGVVLGQTVATKIFPNENADLLAGVFGVILLVLSFVALKLYSRHLEKDPSFRPHILRVV
ncbi:MAG: SoxR reducing system RseC family protein [Thermodesulfobacteriota bacterium]|nr:MAG: SoxR reducing system RseC family protein [Thermodesulfobacteriota bacterium]